MIDRIKTHLDSLFAGAPRTRRVEDLRQELLAGCIDKYTDLTANGMTPDEAYRDVVNGIGDVRELLGHLERANNFDPIASEEKHKRRALFTSVGICFLIISVAVLVFYCFVGLPSVGVSVALICIAVGVFLIVYGRLSTKTHYEKTDDTMVEDIKVKMSRGKKESKLAGLASSSLWCMILVLYFLISFLFGGWHLTWLIFVFGAALQCAMTAYFFPESRDKSLAGAFWCSVVVVYFLISFLVKAWHFSWIVFPLAAAAQQAIKFYQAWREEA